MLSYNIAQCCLDNVFFRGTFTSTSTTDGTEGTNGTNGTERTDGTGRTEGKDSLDIGRFIKKDQYIGVCVQFSWASAPLSPILGVLPD